MFSGSPENSELIIERWAEEFLGGPANDLGLPQAPPEPAFGLPLFGRAAGNDRIWAEIKNAVPGHWTPHEAFKLAYPQAGAEADELTVLSWVLPQTETTLRDQRACSDLPSERWIRNRWHGQKFVMDGLTGFLLERLKDCAIDALAPDFLPQWGDRMAENRQAENGNHPLVSPWSQRHVAFAAGLGTFGLCDGLISPVGKAARFGSLIVRLKLPLSPRPYSGPYDYCLFYNSSGACGRCIKRCPAGAVSEKGHDKQRCREYLFSVVQPHVAEKHPDLPGGYGCGLCQAAVPCERRIPPK